MIVFLRLFPGFILLLLFVGCKDNSVNSAEAPLQLPTSFNGLEADVIFQADTTITRYDRLTNQRISYPYPEQMFTTRNLIISENNRFAYFLDQSLVFESVGTLMRLNFDTGLFETMSEREFNSFRLLGNDWIVFTDASVSCPETPLPFRAFSFMHLSDESIFHLCEAFPAFSELTGLDATPLFSLTDLQIQNNDLFARLSWRNPEVETNPRTVMNVQFTFSGNELIPVSADTAFTTDASGSISPSGRFILQHRNANALWLIDRIEGTESKITDTFSNPSPTFLWNESKVAFLLTRDDAAFDAPSKGLFLFDIESEQFSEILPEANEIERFHFSPSTNQVVVSARFDDIANNRLQIVAIGLNDNQVALLSDTRKENIRPNFVP